MENDKLIERLEKCAEVMFTRLRVPKTDVQFEDLLDIEKQYWLEETKAILNAANVKWRE